MPALTLQRGSCLPRNWGTIMPLSRINGKKRNNSKAMRTLNSLLAVACLLLLSACNNIGSMDFPGVYKISIPQGNIITQEMVDQLRPGMTKRQVIFVMGTPLIRDPYHQDRWDYVYNFQPGGGERGQERLSVLFENDQLVSLSGDFEPTPDETETAPLAAQ
jgi:outer membrane protein assembly factor BamE